MSRFLKVKRNKKEEGITLIALITTIIVLLILAGISIGAITGSNGIIGGAQSAKEETEISQEREIIDISTVEAMGKNNRGNLEEEEFQTALSNHTNGKAEVSDIGEEFEVFFEESGRYYSVDKDGNILDYVVGVTDQYPGDITKKEDGTVLDGSIDKPYEINCIEDLVAFSNTVNGTGKVFVNGKLTNVTKSNFSGKNIVLTRNLNFKSNASYVDSQRTDFGDINGNEGDGNALITEMTTGTGFESIGINEYATSFQGIFDGKNNVIENIFQNNASNLGLFGGASDAEIKNITITGNINSTNYSVGGICATARNTKLTNCHNKANITEERVVSGNNASIGGIIGSTLNNCEIINCSNTGDVKGDFNTGGITGNIDGSIINCYNLGNITGGRGANYGAVGGIAGGNSASLIYNCFNIGEITSNNTGNNAYASAGGILGSSWQTGTNCKIINAYNLGKINNATRGYGAIVGGYWYGNIANTATLINTYYKEDGDLLGYGNFSSAQGVEKKDQEYMYSENLVTDLNNYIENNTDEIDTSQWKKWMLGENKYPVFVEN